MIQIMPLQAGGGLLWLVSVQSPSKSTLLLSNCKKETFWFHNKDKSWIIWPQIVVEGPFTEVELNAVNKTTHITYSRWCITRENTINYLFDQGMFIQETFIDKLSVEQQILVSNMVGNLVMQSRASPIFKLNAIAATFQQKIRSHLFFHTSSSNSKDGEHCRQTPFSS